MVTSLGPSGRSRDVAGTTGPPTPVEARPCAGVGAVTMLASISRSVLYRAGGHASGHVALGDDEQERSRNRGDDRGGHDRVPVLGVVPEVPVDADGNGLQGTATIEGRGEQEV